METWRIEGHSIDIKISASFDRNVVGTIILVDKKTGSEIERWEITTNALLSPVVDYYRTNIIRGIDFMLKMMLK